MKQLVTLVVLAALVLGLVVLGMSNPTTSVAHLGVLQVEAIRDFPDPSTTSATAGITMYTEPDD